MNIVSLVFVTNLFSVLVFCKSINKVTDEKEIKVTHVEPEYINIYRNVTEFKVLENNTFPDIFHGDRKHWIVEFYSSYCGHCINFAPEFKKFNSLIKENGWNSTIQVGALDCTYPSNVKLCRDYRINQFPIVMFFSNTSTIGKKGVSMHLYGKTLSKMITILTETMEVHGKFGEFSPIHDLESVNKEEKAILISDSSGISAKHAIFNFEKRTKWRIFWHKPRIRNLKMTVMFVRDEKIHILRDGITNYKTLRKVLIAFLMKNGGIGQTVIHSMANTNWHTEATLRKDLDRPYKRGDHKVYAADMYSAISIALTRDVALHQVLDGVRLKSLVAFLTVLRKYFSGSEKWMKSIHFLENKVGKESAISADDWIKLIEESKLPHLESWTRCVGSRAHLRRYPCGLWTLFHSLTVQCYLHEIQDQDAQYLLLAIRNFIMNFFSCTSCGRNFDKETATLLTTNQRQTPRSAMIYLWRVHNSVNKRLYGYKSHSNDPDFPKLPFPYEEDCPQCWNHDELQEEAVEKFLVKLYRRENWSLQRGAGFAQTATRLPPSIDEFGLACVILFCSFIGFGYLWYFLRKRRKGLKRKSSSSIV